MHEYARYKKYQEIKYRRRKNEATSTNQRTKQSIQGMDEEIEEGKHIKKTEARNKVTH